MNRSRKHKSKVIIGVITQYFDAARRERSDGMRHWVSVIREPLQINYRPVELEGEVKGLKLSKVSCKVGNQA